MLTTLSILLHLLAILVRNALLSKFEAQTSNIMAPVAILTLAYLSPVSLAQTAGVGGARCLQYVDLVFFSNREKRRERIDMFLDPFIFCIQKI